MNIADEAALQRMLNNKLSSNIWFMFGNDDYLKEFYCKKIEKLCVNESLAAFNLHIYNDDDSPYEEIFAAAEGLPMMSEYAFYLVRNYPLHELKSEQLKDFEQYLSDVPPSSVILFYYNTIEVTYNRSNNAKWAAIIELFAKYGVIVQLDHRTPQKIAQMLQKKAPTLNTQISEELALTFLSTVGEDIQIVLNEFTKLCSFADGKPITAQMIEAVCTKSTQAKIFDLGAAVLTGAADNAFSIVNQLLNQKTAVQLIIGTLASFYTNLYRYGIAVQSEKSIKSIVEMFAYKNDFVFRDTPSLFRKTSLPAVENSIEILLRADVTTKSQGFEPYTLMSGLIAELAAVK